MSNCKGRYQKKINPTTGDVEAIIELVDENGSHLNPANVITDAAGIAAALGNMTDPCVSEIDWENTEEYVCVTDDGSGSTPSGAPETWRIKEWHEKGENPTDTPVKRREQWFDSNRSIAFQEDFDETGVSTSTSGTKPPVTGFTLGQCSINSIYVSSC